MVLVHFALKNIVVEELRLACRVVVPSQRFENVSVEHREGWLVIRSTEPERRTSPPTPRLRRTPSFARNLLRWFRAKDGGAEGIRTPDPHNAIVVLYQLSYDPNRF